MFFKKRSKVQFRSQAEVTAYWKTEGVHQLSPAELDEMLRLMVDDVTFQITSRFFQEKLGALCPEDHVLDAGCGWGRSLIGLKRRYPEVPVTGVDITAQTLQLGRQLAERLSLKKVEWREGSLLALEFPGNTFSHVISSRCLHYMVEPEQAVEELLRVVRPGGRLVVLIPNRWNPVIRGFYHMRTYSPPEMAAWFSQKGAEVIEHGSLGFIPPFKFLRPLTFLAHLDPLMRRVPMLNKLGGLAYCVAKKNA